MGLYEYVLLFYSPYDIIIIRAVIFIVVSRNFIGFFSRRAKFKTAPDGRYLKHWASSQHGASQGSIIGHVA